MYLKVEKFPDRCVFEFFYLFMAVQHIPKFMKSNIESPVCTT
jgi:hypothetical protein